LEDELECNGKEAGEMVKMAKLESSEDVPEDSL
jgi:hypothetical protein